MYERIIEIIAYVISELRQNKSLSAIDLSELEQRGYSQAEISTAFSWLADRVHNIDGGMRFLEANSKSFRVFHPFEMEVLTPEARGELLQMVELGMITNEQVEMIVERAMLSGMSVVDPADIRNMVAMIVFNAQSPYGSNGSHRIMLSGNDTIH